MSTTSKQTSDPVLVNLNALLPSLEALYKDIHAHPELSMQETRTAALAGAAVVVIGHMLHLPAVATTITGGCLCFALRFMAIRYGWHLPKARA